MSMRIVVNTIALVATTTLLGCGAKPPQPQIASSAQQSGYASTYPQRVEATLEDFSEREQEARAVAQELSTYPGQLDKPDWAVVSEVVARADEAGNSSAYVERAREVRGALDFFEAENEDITKKVAGTAQYNARQKGCDIDVYGSVAHALKEAVNKQSEERLREGNEAHRVIERESEQLGKKNTDTLVQQADKIAYASYIVRVHMVEAKLDVERMNAEAEDIRATATQRIEAEKQLQADASRSSKEKEASRKRSERMQAALSQLDATAAAAGEAEKKMQQRIEAAQKAYTDAIQKLKEDLSKRAAGK